MLTDITAFAPPALAAQAARLASRMRIADRMNPPVNLIDLERARAAGAAVPRGRPDGALLPGVDVADGQGLNMTVQSYLDNLDFGLISCRELVPDLSVLCDGLEDSMAELLKAAAV